MSELSVLGHALAARFEKHTTGGRFGADLAEAIAAALADVGIVPGQAPASGDATGTPIAALEKLIAGAKDELSGKLAEVFNEFSTHQVAAVQQLRDELERLEKVVEPVLALISGLSHPAAAPAAPEAPNPQPAAAAPAAPQS